MEEALTHLLNIIKSFPQGASIEMIQDTYNEAVNGRTLRRYLKTLLDGKMIRSTGAARSTKYHWIVPGTSKGVEATDITAIDGGVATIQISEAGLAIQERIQQQEENRAAVGYDLEFLNEYQPNETYYLAEEERSRLMTLGRTNQGEQPAGTYARQILQRLLIDLSWNSSRLEGNTYSLLDTQRLLALGQAAPEKSATEAQMILNHKEAIEFLVDSAGEIGFNRYTITNLHGLLSNNLLSDSAASGRLRSHAVGIQRSVYIPLAIPQLIEECFEAMLRKAEEIADPFEQAFFVMVHIPYLQPFDDVNKRVSRLAANIPLNRLNLAPLSFVDVPKDLYIQGLLGVYELQEVDLLKDVFLWAYERSCLRYAALRQTLGEPDRFRMEHREAIRALVNIVVSQAMTHQDAQTAINTTASGLPEADRNRFVEVVETELLSLHPGNIARYRIRPSEFDRWQEAWNRGIQ